MKQKIHINDQGELLLIDSPEMPERVILHDHHFEFTTSYRKKWIAYDQALTVAIEKGIKIRDQEAVFRLLFNQTQRSVGFNFWKDHLKKGQSFDLPNSYTAEVQEEWRHNKNAPWHELTNLADIPLDVEFRKVAVLIPLKQEPEKPKEYVSFGSIPKGELKIFVAKYPEYHFERWVEGDSVFYSNGHTTSEHALADDPVYGDGYVILDRDTQKLYIFKDGKLVESGEPWE